MTRTSPTEIQRSWQTGWPAAERVTYDVLQVDGKQLARTVVSDVVTSPARRAGGQRWDEGRGQPAGHAAGGRTTAPKPAATTSAPKPATAAVSTPASQAVASRRRDPSPRPHRSR